MKQDNGRAELWRTITLPTLVLYGLGTTIGAKIYTLTGVVAGAAGAPHSGSPLPSS